ncbi:P-loop containing nucleoside triphosphate hydrolase protein [Zychaea mexicana]|uniref:P-loop containing nucleoside triphosphate hydrolase protein n=1 Tax=Zychaea mexicana TaxID=64656 RepID=UPI0022FEF912|nr:P-loop containing nucleoside triphosphate hydrolase protein [Zychaea mexicana]KAI9497617.1 P-loop containing nucleoside triphosphate hydrolase protein [Zychaea mexicana]
MLNDSTRIGMNNSNTRRSSGSLNRRSSEKPRIVKKPVEEKGTNIQVVLRCRGRNEQEIAANSPVILEAKRRRDVVLRNTGKDKDYSFDRVFGPESTQEEIYGEVAQPILDEVLMGYNCTIFAYGQTGTGKTYTMEGELEERHGRLTPRAGIIPRAIYKLFETLDAQHAEYSVKVSLIELYNEELRDLLNNDDTRTLRIFEDQSGSGVIVQGMEESIISSAAEALTIMQEGSKNRSIAFTKCNEKSSRSHCIFTLTVHIKEIIPGGEEVLKVGKLNLVDLAGSENINRSGAEHARAREAGMINQSLLTLGRVINHLVDHSQHIPYRESKLTRLLKDSLGGRTKTCLIATISVCKMNQEEIISTLDYAKRAKNIRNRPEANQRMYPKVLLREYEQTIERLKADLQASREQKGVYLSQQTYSMLTDENQSSKDRVVELTRDIDGLRDSLRERTKELDEKADLLFGKESELAQVQNNLKTLDRKLGESIAEFTERMEQYTNHTEKSIDGIIQSLEQNSDVMQALVREGVRAQNEFSDKMEKIRSKLRDQAQQKKECAEKEVTNFFSSFEKELEGLVGNIRTIEDHFTRTYKQHVEDERQHIETQNTSVTKIRDTTITSMSDEKQRVKKHYSMVQNFISNERGKEKDAEAGLMISINKIVSEWRKQRAQRLESSLRDLQSSFKDNAHDILFIVIIIPSIYNYLTNDIMHTYKILILNLLLCFSLIHLSKVSRTTLIQ